MFHCADFICHLIKAFADEIFAVCSKFDIELLEICFDIDTLHICVKIFIDEHKVGVKLNTAVLTHCYAHLVTFAGRMVSFCYGTVLDQR